jgi:hypothetical protein
MDTETLAANLFSGILIAAVAARITVHYALKRFYSEKWWERKSEAYTAILEALHHVRNHADTNFEFTARGQDLPKEGDIELTQKLQDAMAELRKRIDVGSFVISPEGVSALQLLMRKLEESTQTTDWNRYLALRLPAINDCLESMRAIAKKDLSM